MTKSSPIEERKLLILPKNRHAGSRIITLANPRSNVPNKYFFCPENGVYEFTRIAAPKASPRSWLVVRSTGARGEDKDVDANDVEGSQSRDTESKTEQKTVQENTGYTSSNADLFVATSVDPLFLVLPALEPGPQPGRTESTKQLYLSADDYFETLTNESEHFAEVLKQGRVRQIFLQRMEAICDTVDAGDEKMYRLSIDKLVNEVKTKSERMIAQGLPPSMEEKFVRRALDIPVLNVHREDSFTSKGQGADVMEEDSVPQLESGLQTPSESESQTTASTSFQSVSEASTSATTISTSEGATTTMEVATTIKANATPPITAPDGVPELLRLRTALSFIMGAYIPRHICAKIEKALAESSSPVDFAPLTAHLNHIAEVRTAALASRSMGDFSRKRTLEEEEAAEDRREKKRLKEEEEKKKKAGQSRGVKELAKVNTSGMKKLSSFFGKAVKR